MPYREAIARERGAWAVSPGILENADRTFQLRPLGILSGGAGAWAIERQQALPLAGGPLAFSLLEIIGRRDAARTIVPVNALRSWAERHHGAAAERAESLIAILTAPRAPWSGLSFERPLLMGIVNVTPDSFSDGSDFPTPDEAIAHGRTLAAAGADILDVGGESTRPGATPVPPMEEIRRITPVVRGLAETGAIVSIDTRHAAVMEAAFSCGARIINDVSALTGDTASLTVAAKLKAPIVLMHMRGDPQTMQQDPVYDSAPLDILEFLESRIVACAEGGILRERIVVDPGLGFGKRLRHNLELLAHLSLFHITGCPVLLGASRKSFISRAASRGETPKQRVPGSLAAGLIALDQGVQILRVHDVAETRQAVQVWQGIRAAG